MSLVGCAAIFYKPLVLKEFIDWLENYFSIQWQYPKSPINPLDNLKPSLDPQDVEQFVNTAPQVAKTLCDLLRTDDKIEVDSCLSQLEDLQAFDDGLLWQFRQLLKIDAAETLREALEQHLQKVGMQN